MRWYDRKTAPKSPFYVLKENNDAALERDRKNNRYILEGLPRWIGLITDEICNLKCIMCYQRLKSPEELRNPPVIEEKYFIRFAEQVFPTARILCLNVAGEPVLSRLLPLELALAEKYGLYLEVTTNGMFFDCRDSIKRIVRMSQCINFSFDSPVQDTYESIRPGSNFLHVTQNMRLFQRYKHELPFGRRPWFSIIMVLMRRNLGELLTMVKFAKDIGADSLNVAHLFAFERGMQEESLNGCQEVDTIVHQAQRLARKIGIYLNIPSFYSVSNQPEQRANSQQERIGFSGSGVIPQKPEIKDGSGVNPGTTNIVNRLRKRCPFLWERVYLNWNAEIIPCCAPPSTVMGSIKENSFVDIWNNDKYQTMRKTFIGGQPYELCANCAKSGYLSKTNF